MSGVSTMVNSTPPPTPHQPVRPEWSCAACAEEWPCRPRRDEIVAECAGSRVMIALYMASYFGDALDDHPADSADLLYARFMGWFRNRPR